MEGLQQNSPLYFWGLSLQPRTDRRVLRGPFRPFSRFGAHPEREAPYIPNFSTNASSEMMGTPNSLALVFLEEAEVRSLFTR